MSQTSTDSENDFSENSYDGMLATLNTTINDLMEKIENGRIRNVEREKVRIKQHRALTYLIRTKRDVLEDKKLEELEQKIEEMEAARR